MFTLKDTFSGYGASQMPRRTLRNLFKITALLSLVILSIIPTPSLHGQTTQVQPLQQMKLQQIGMLDNAYEMVGNFNDLGGTVAWSVEDDLLAVALHDRINIWDWKGNRVARQLVYRNPPNNISDIFSATAITPISSFFIATGNYATLFCGGGIDCEHNPVILGNSAVIATSPVSDVIAQVNDQGWVILTPLNDISASIRFQAHSGSIQTLTFSKDGNLVATVGRFDNTIRVWDITSLGQIAEYPIQNGSYVQHLEFVPNTNTFLTLDGFTVRRWDIATQSEIPLPLHNDASGAFSEQYFGLSVSPDGSLIAVGTGKDTDRYLELWDISFTFLLDRISVTNGYFSLSVLDTAFSHDGKMIAVGTGGQQTLIYAVTAIEIPSMGDNTTISSTIPTYLCPNAPPSIMSVGVRARVAYTDGTTTRLRSAPSGSASIVVDIPEGTTFDVVSGPECVGAYAWWQLRLADGTTGWAAEGNSEKYFIEPSLETAQVQNSGLALDETLIGSWQLSYVPPDADTYFTQVEFHNDGTVQTSNRNMTGNYEYISDEQILIHLYEVPSSYPWEFSAKLNGDKLEITDFNGMHVFPTYEFVREIGALLTVTEPNGLFVHNGATVGNPQLGAVSPGESYVVIGKDSTATWLQIQYYETTGWICNSGVQFANNDISVVPVTEYLSYGCGDTHDIHDPSTIDGILTGAIPQIAQIFFINGIATSYQDHVATLPLVRKTFGGKPVMGIYNATVDRWEDVAQSIVDINQGVSGNRIGFDFWNAHPDNPAVQALIVQVKSHFRNYRTELPIIAHSQGTAIVSAALNLLAQDSSFIHLPDITVYTFGNVALTYPYGPYYHHCIHYGDIIALPFLPSLEQSVQLNDRAKVAPISGPNPLPDILLPDAIQRTDNHNLDQYLNDFASGKCTLGE